MTMPNLSDFGSLPKLVTLEEAVGKTVAAAVKYVGFCAVRFDDGTGLVLEADNDWDDIACLEECTDANACDVTMLKDVGLIPQETYSSYRAAEEHEHNERRQEHDRATYERLKAKFEGKEHP